MKLVSKKVNKKLDEYKIIKDLMLKEFPKNELLPMWLLFFLSKRKMVDFNAYYIKDEFVGISYSIVNCDMVFIFYLAVDDKSQSRGYGTQILNCIKEKYKDKEITLDIEKIDESSKNYEQRVRRLRFYQKNGFYNTNYYIEDDTDYLILSTNKTLDKNGFINVIKKYSFGLYVPYIKK